MWNEREKRGDNVAEIGFLDSRQIIQATCALRTCSSLILLIPLLFHDECCNIGPCLMYGGSDNTQFTMGTSGHMVTLWAVDKHCVSIKVQKHAKGCFLLLLLFCFFQKENSYLQRTVELCLKYSRFVL